MAVIVPQMPVVPDATRKVDFRARQKRRILNLLPGDWPQSRSDMDIAYNQNNAIADAVGKILQDSERGESLPEYGAQHLSFYRDLRDLLYKRKQEPTGDQRIKATSGHTASTLIDELWQELQGLEHPTTPPTNPLKFPGREFGLQDPSGVTELARGYDECILRAQKVWNTTEGEEDGVKECSDLMAAVGAAMADWCVAYTPNSDLDLRFALYRTTDDESYMKWLSSLQIPRDCHMKDALLKGMTAHQVVETVMVPCTAMFCESPSQPGYDGRHSWPKALMMSLTFWADYAGANDAKSSAGLGAFDILAAPASALASASGLAADEIKATTITLYGAELGLFRPKSEQSCTAVWRSRGYDGTVHAVAAAIALTGGTDFPRGPLDERSLDLGGAIMAVHDCVDCEADAINKIGWNIILTAAYEGIGIECILDTVYATFAFNWAATDTYGQLCLSVLQEQAAGSRWGGPVYLAESRAASGGNLWKDSLSADRIAQVAGTNILPTTTQLLRHVHPGSSWHDIALQQSADEILSSPFVDEKTARLEDILLLSKGTLTLACCASCSVCSEDPAFHLHQWDCSSDQGTSRRVLNAVKRLRDIIDGPVKTLRAWLRSNPRPDAVYHPLAEAFMAGTLESRYQIALLEALAVEDALYHGTDLLNHCVGWLTPNSV